MSKLENEGYIYKKAFSEEQIYAFDEVCYAVSVYNLFMKKGKKIYERDLSYNSSTKHFALCRVRYDRITKRWIEESGKNDQIYWVNGKIYRIFCKNKKLNMQEFLYIHLQMRNMEFEANTVLDKPIIKIEPHRFVGLDLLSETSYEVYKNDYFYIDTTNVLKWFYCIKGKFKRNRPLKWDKPWEYNPYIEKKN